MDDPLGCRFISLRKRRGLPCLTAIRTSAFFRTCRLLQIEHNVFARTMHAHDLFALERLSDHAGWRLERLFPGTDPDGFDGVTGDTLVQAAHNRFDFGEFG